MKRISIVYSDCYLDHETGSHVENPGRIKAIQRALTTAPWSDQLDWIQPRRASVDEIAMIHDRDYIEYIRRSCETARGITYLNPDTAISPDSYEVALQAAGGVFEGIDRVVSDSAAGFFALVRPPGHHAEANEALGFCIFNNIAIGAKYAQLTHGLKKVFILDWDVHHGNGTQHSLYEDPTVFFASFHQYPYYPGTGGMTEMGKDKGLGFTMNFPMRARSTDDDYMLLMEECVFPAIKKFQPDLLLISAGFDAHRDDPLGAILLTESCYGAMLECAREAAGDACKVGIVLEGGYNYDSLASCSSKVVGVFTGEDHHGYAAVAKSPGSQALELVRFHQERHPILRRS